MSPATTSRDFLEVDDSGRLEVNLHRGQAKAWRSKKRFVSVIAGTQSGKTCFGPIWLKRELKRCGPGDYLVVSPTYKLLLRKALPEFQRMFDREKDAYVPVGTLNKSDWVFNVDDAGERRLFGSTQDADTKIFFGSADDPDSLESATAKAAWLDEAGQRKFKLGSWEAILRRLGLHEGRALITTTPYNLGWLKKKIWDPWEEADRDHPDIDVVRFRSVDNPVFPRSEWERAKRDLPTWKFNLYYRAIFTRPAGLIYSDFDPEEHTCPRFDIPKGWPRYVGVDFGGVNTAAVFYARDPESGRLYAYREYWEGGKTAEEHVEAMLNRDDGPEDPEPMPRLAAGGSASEDQMRREYRSGGLPLKSPDVDSVEVGIDRVIGFHKRDELIVFDDLDHYLDQKETYSRKLDDDGEPTEEIEDKSEFHLMDAERYVLQHLAPQASTAPPTADEIGVLQK